MTSPSTLLVVVHEDNAGPGRLAPELTAAGLDLDVRRPDRGDPLPDDLAGFAGLMVLGGTMGACDDDLAGWLPRTRRLLAEGVEREVPTFGICLGGQLLAVATGGDVERGAPGVEVGVVRVSGTPAAAGDPLLGPVLAAAGDPFPVAAYHEDAITRLPGGAVLLATGPVYGHQAYRLGTCAWGVQYHPEVTATDFSVWLRGGDASLRAAGQDPAALAAAYRDAVDAVAVVARAHARAFAEVVHSRAGVGGDAPPAPVAR